MISNPYDLPLAYVNAVSKQRIPQPKTISVTELIQPPQLRALWLEFHSEIPLVAGQDDHDLFHGNAVHAYLEQHAPRTALAEHKLEYEIDGWTITGTPDVVDWFALNGTVLIDWKTTKVRALKYDKLEWEQQTNLYAHLLRLVGIDVSAITVWAFLKDWDRALLSDPEYPRSHACRRDVPLWPTVKAHDFLMTRLRLHQAAEAGSYGPCTSDDRWSRTSFALMKKGNTRATKLFESADDAAVYAAATLDPIQHVEDFYDIDVRQGEPLRCMNYCRVAAYCKQWEVERMEQQERDREAGAFVKVGGAR